MSTPPNGTEPSLSQGQPPPELPQGIRKLSRRALVTAVLREIDVTGHFSPEDTPDDFPVFFLTHDRTAFIIDPAGATDFLHEGDKPIGTVRDLRIRMQQDPKIQKLIDRELDRRQRQWEASQREAALERSERVERQRLEAAAPALKTACEHFLALVTDEFLRTLPSEQHEALQQIWVECKIAIDSARPPESSDI